MSRLVYCGKVLLNVPWSLAALIAGIVSLPKRAFVRNDAVILEVKSLWWYPKGGVRAMTLGNVVILGPNVEKNDLEHELVHVEQSMRVPFFHPLLSLVEQSRHRGLANKYECEAYERAHNQYYDS